MERKKDKYRCTAFICQI